MDLAANIEIVLYELHSTMYWVSVLELTVFSIALVMFFSLPSQMAFVFLHLMHVPRGILGLFIDKDLPKSHDIVQNVMFSLKDDTMTEESPISFEVFRERATNRMREIFPAIFKDFETRLKAYFVVTGVATLMDTVEFFIQLVRFGRPGAEYSCIVMLTVTVLLMCIDCHYLCWVQSSLRYQFPSYITAHLSEAALGFSEKMGKTLHANIRRFT